MKRKSIVTKLRNYFITGVVVLIPIGITLYLTLFFVKVSSKIIPKEINPNHYLPFSIPGLEIVLSFIFIIIIGWLSLSFIGKKILLIVNDLFKRIPILRTIYSAVGQMTQSFAQDKSNRKSVVLIEYPRKGSWAVGFATKKNKGEISDKTKEALKMQMNKARVEQSLNTVMMSDYWEAYTITVEDFEMMAMYGETMKFDPKAASRLISKLADFVKRMSVTYEELI